MTSGTGITQHSNYALTLPNEKICVWRLDDNLLQDKKFCAKIWIEIKDFCETNTSDTMPITVWEASKVFTRGLFASDASNKIRLGEGEDSYQLK